MNEPKRAIAMVEDNAPVAMSDSQTLLQVISRAASDPTIDVEKMERLMAMAERMEARNAKTAYIRALKEMKPKLPVIDRKGRIEVRKKGPSGERDGEIQQSTGFARWEDIDEAITPVLEAHGFVLSFRPGVATDGKITVTGILSHDQGHQEEATITLPHDTTGSKNSVQAVGSSNSYAKRYAATMLLNIRTRGEDDDGKLAGADEPIDADELAQLQDLIDRSHSDIEKFAKYMGVDALINLTKGDMRKAREALNLALDQWQRKHPKAKS